MQTPDEIKGAYRVDLLGHEIERCETWATQKVRVSKERGWVSKTASDPLPFHVHGCIAEYAVALMLNLRLPPAIQTIQEYWQGDLPGNIEVKACRDTDQSRWNLVVNADQLKDERLYVNVVTAYSPRIFVLGAGSGKRIRAEGRTSTNSGTGHAIHILDRNLLVPPMRIFEWVRNELGPVHDVALMFQY